MSITFKAIQTYSDGSKVSWIEVAAPVSGVVPDHPAQAPVLTRGAASANTSVGVVTKSSSSSKTGPIELSVIVLVVAAGALGLGVVSRTKGEGGEVLMRLPWPAVAAGVMLAAVGTVCGVTIRPNPPRWRMGMKSSSRPISARSTRVILGRAAAWRCNTVSWWRSNRISADFHDSDRRDSRSHLNSRLTIRWRRRDNARSFQEGKTAETKGLTGADSGTHNHRTYVVGRVQVDVGRTLRFACAVLAAPR